MCFENLYAESKGDFINYISTIFDPPPNVCNVMVHQISRNFM